MIKKLNQMIEKLGFATNIEIKCNNDENMENITSIMTKQMEVIIPLGDLIDKEAEKTRLEEEIKKLEQEVLRCEKMLSNPGFTSKAPQTKIEEEKSKLLKYKEQLSTAKERYEAL